MEVKEGLLICGRRKNGGGGNKKEQQSEWMWSEYIVCMDTI
jgi:hypothetical protein